MRFHPVSLVAVAALIACSSTKKTDHPDTNDTGKTEGIIIPDQGKDAPDADTSIGEVSEGVEVEDPGQDPGPEQGPSIDVPPITQPVPLRVGVAVARMPAPLGINTSGFGPAAGEKSPFTGPAYPATTGLYMHPTLKAVVIEGGMGRLILVLGDLIGMSGTAREAILKRLEKRTGRDFSNELIVGGTHTHSGPGRMTQGAFELVQDSFFPEFFDRMMNAIADVVIEAFADLEEARFGFTIAQNHQAHSDRRCENPDFEAPDMPLIRFDRKDGTTKALVMTYAIHGTVLDNTEFLLSKDVAGGMEYKVEEWFSAKVPVLVFNSWAGDMGPGDAPPPAGPVLSSEVFDKFNRIEGIGNLVAQTVADAFPSIQMSDKADVSGLTVWIPMDRKTIGYPDGVFPYDYGGVYCGGGDPKANSHCWTPGISPDPVADLDKMCIPFTEDLQAPNRTVATVARIGDLILVTFPGEAVTQIGIDLRDKIGQIAGGKKVAFMGYTQDYIGYSTPEWDWWQGGYEASGAIWGPKQGDYLAARILEVAHKFFDPKAAFSFLPAVPYKPPDVPYEPRKPTASVDPGQVVTDVLAQYAKTDMVKFDFAGGDPWLLAPLVSLEIKKGDAFEPFARHNGTVVNSDGYEFSIKMVPDPAYSQVGGAEPAARKFVWKYNMPLTRVADMKTPIMPGKYRLRVKGSYSDEAGAVHEMDVNSAEFAVQ